LDGNKLTEHTKVPRLEKLHTLWVNRNNIANLTLFINKLVESTPNLKHLSMLNNDACPNFFNGGSLKQYKDYRCYVISRLRTLTVLDDTNISSQEKEQAIQFYGNLDMTVAREEDERKRLKELEDKRQEERIAKKKKDTRTKKAKARDVEKEARRRTNYKPSSKYIKYKYW